jgi:succinyl-CoA synthetase beta subunit
MRLYEYQGKELVRAHGIPVPEGYLVTSPEEAERVAELLGEVALKAQVLSGGRGKAGGVLFASSPKEARKRAEELFSKKVHGYRVEKLLVEKKLRIEKEIYIGIIVDRSTRKPAIIVSPKGGVDIESVPPEYLKVRHLSPNRGLSDARDLTSFLGMSGEEWIIEKLYEIFTKYDMQLLEINPLIYDGNSYIAADVRAIVDDNALFRQNFEINYEEMNERERMARERGIAYVELDGDIGIIGNGAGLVMATMDLVYLRGGKPADFCDLGGGADRERVKEAIKIVLQHPSLKKLLINILGGITRCDEVALGILEASPNVPTVIRMMGTKEEEGREILEKAGIKVEKTLEEAVESVVKWS